MFLQLFFLCTCIPLYAADAKHFFEQGYLSTSNSQAVVFFKKAFDDKFFGPSARYNAGLLERERRAKKMILSPLINANCFEFPDPMHVFELQRGACDQLMQAYEHGGSDDDLFKIAFNQIILKQNYDIEQDNHGIVKHDETELFSGEYANALAIICDYALKHCDFESRYVSFVNAGAGPIDAATLKEHRFLLNKIFDSAATLGISSAKLRFILDPNNGNRIHEFESFYDQDPELAIDRLCIAVQHGNKIARELAIFLAVNKKYTQEQEVLLSSISKDHTQRKEHSKRTAAASSSTNKAEAAGLFAFYASKYLIEESKKSFYLGW